MKEGSILRIAKDGLGFVLVIERWEGRILRKSESDAMRF